MPRFYVWSPDADGDCLAYKLHTEGEEVVLRIEEEWLRPNLEGIVPHTQAAPKRGDIVIFGTSKAGKDAQALQKQGFPVLSASPLADTLEMNRWAFLETCKTLRVPVPPTEHFHRYDAARQFLKRHDDQRYVFKPSGDQDAACTYVANDAEDMLGMLDVFERQMPADFLLQEFIEGVEISLEGWFDGNDWIDGSWNATKETKKFMAGDIGPATGCSTSIVYAYDEEPAWARRLHRRFTALLRAAGHIGPLDLNTIQTATGDYVLEPCLRFGYEAIQNYVELWDEPFGVVMEQLANGTLTYLDVDAHQLAAAVRLSIPPYPHISKDHRAPKDVPILIDEGDVRWLWCSGVREEDGQRFSAPTYGFIGALTAVGTQVDKTAHELLARAKRINIPNLQYRNDIGAGHMVLWEQLAEWDFPLPPIVEGLLEKKPAVLPRSPFAHQAWRAV